MVWHAIGAALQVIQRLIATIGADILVLFAFSDSLSS